MDLNAVMESAKIASPDKILVFGSGQRWYMVCPCCGTTRNAGQSRDIFHSLAIHLDLHASLELTA